MITLAIRTDKPEAELYLLRDEEQLAAHKWEAHRELGTTLHQQIRHILDEQNLTVDEINHITVFEGPGSFTGLRIGISVANAFAYALAIPITAASGDSWLRAAYIQGHETVRDYVTPLYGSDPHITQQKK